MLCFPYADLDLRCICVSTLISILPLPFSVTENIVAADKVALIISNRTYAPHMSNLITPHCDAETLAENLQQMKFKTVTVGDLTLEEMKFVIREYRKLLGEGVYGQ